MNPEAQSEPRGLPRGQLAKAFESVNYRDGAIAKREIAKTTTGSVMILAFDEGQSLSEHTAPVAHPPRE